MIKISLEGIEKLKSAGQKIAQIKRSLPDRIRKLSDLWGARVVQTSRKKYLSGSRPEKLDVVTGNLRTRIRHKVESRSNETKIVIGTDVPYARIHEMGGVNIVPVTPKSRKFFWAKFRETGIEKWRGMALTKRASFEIKIKKRPFLAPAVQDNLRDLKNNLNRILGESLVE